MGIHIGYVQCEMKTVKRAMYGREVYFSHLASVMPCHSMGATKQYRTKCS